MLKTETTVRRSGAIGRADLLLAQHRLSLGQTPSNVSSFVSALGFAIRTKRTPVLAHRVDSQTPASEEPLLPMANLDAGLTQFGIWVCNACQERVERPTPAQARSASVALVREKRHAPAIKPFHRSAQLLNLWDNTLSDTRHSHRLDVLRVVKNLSEAKPIRTLPRLTRSSFTTELVLMLDMRDRLRTLWLDQLAIYGHLDQLLGQQCRLIAFNEGPDQLLSHLKHEEKVAKWEAPSGSRVVIVSDFDAIETDRSLCKRKTKDWRAWLDLLVARGNQVSTLGVQGCSPSPLVNHQGLLGGNRSTDDTNALISAMCRGHLCTAERLRYLRKELCGSDQNALATEIAVWNHPDRKRSYGGQWSIKSHKREHWLSQYRALGHPERECLDFAISRWRESLYADHAGLEAMIDDNANLGPGPDAAAFSGALKMSGGGTIGQSKLSSWLFSVHELICDVAEKYKDELEMKPLLTEAQRHAERFGLRQPLGLKYITPSNFFMSFKQSGQDLIAVEDAHQSAVWQGPGNPLELDSQRIIKPGDRLNRDDYTLQTKTHRVELKRLYRPRWAESLHKDSDGNVFAMHQAGANFQFLEANADRAEATWVYDSGVWPWASKTGIDTFGLWAEFTINDVEQRLRWIPSGTFQMGSPEGEPERNSDEHIRTVTLTEGYWLADTACTQELWEAVMGENPSHFKGNNLPVESVSWDDVQEFIVKLKAELPQLPVALPTEAQWEYAARAGTQTPFWWGEELSPQKANYDGTRPYAEGEKGEFRQETLLVKEFEPNPWGLYQVHGNVEEWCADWYGPYPSIPVINPIGAESGEGRVFRGGSWFGRGGWLRAAARFRGAPDDRGYDLGFRLSAGQSDAEP